MRARRILRIAIHSATAPFRSPTDAGRPVAFLVASLASAAALNLGGCAEPMPERLAATHPKEYFPSSIWGPSSPRVVADGEPVPRGGGTYMVGNPYTIAGKTYYPSQKRYVATGLASWYGDAFHGRRTANGEVYDRDAISAAHPTMPLPSYARVTNLRNHYSMIVRVNDRGPFTEDRIMDVSRTTAEVLGFSRKGTTPLKVEYIGAADLAGSDDLKLLATLRFDRPASLDGLDLPRRIAANGTPLATDGAKVQRIAFTTDKEDNGRDPALPDRRLSPSSAPLPPPRPPELRKVFRAKNSIALR